MHVAEPTPRLEPAVVIALWIALVSAAVSLTANLGAAALGGVSKWWAVQICVAAAIIAVAARALHLHRRRA